MQLALQGLGQEVQVSRRAKPTIITLDDGRQISSNGLHNTPLVAEWLLGLGSRWVTIAEVARFSKHSASPRVKKYIRGKVRELVVYFRQHGIVLLVEYAGDFNAATAVKIYRGETHEEEIAALATLEKMGHALSIKASEMGAMRTIMEEMRKSASE